MATAAIAQNGTRRTGCQGDTATTAATALKGTRRAGGQVQRQHLQHVKVTKGSGQKFSEKRDGAYTAATTATTTALAPAAPTYGAERFVCACDLPAVTWT